MMKRFCTILVGVSLYWQSLFSVGQLPLYENPQLYQQLAEHNMRMLPSWNGSVAALQQQINLFLQQQLSKETYEQFLRQQLIRQLMDAYGQAVEGSLTIQYAQRSLRLIQRYEAQIKQLKATIEQLQAQEPLKVSYDSAPITTGPILPEEVPAVPQPQKRDLQDEDDKEESEAKSEDQEESQDEEQENAQEEKPLVSTTQLRRQSAAQNAVYNVKLAKFQKEFQENQEAEKAGTAKPGWREYMAQKWNQLKSWTSSWVSGQSEE